MLNFRKVLLAAAVAGLGLVGTASAQVPSCTPSVATQGYVAVEGTTEALPTFTLTCTGAASFTGPITISVTGSVNFVNQAQSSTVTNLDVLATDTGGDTVSTIAQPGPNTINVTFNTVTPASTQVFNISGLRVNPSGLPVASTVTLSAGSSSVLVSSATAISAAFVAKTIGTVYVNSATLGGIPANTSVCTNTGTSAAPSTALTAAASIGVTANFLDAFKSVTDYQYGITSVFGFDSVAVAPKQGTRFAVTFSNLNTAGVNYYVPSTLGGTNVTLTAYAGATGSTVATAATTPASAAGQILLSVSAAGTATVYYGVTGGGTTISGSVVTPTGSQSFVIPVSQIVPIPANVSSYSTTAIGASLQLVGAASPSYPGASTTQTAATGTAATTNATNGLVTSCSTTLLFPYVTNSQGFDTGLAISNAASGTGAAASTGSCNLTFYGTGGANTSPYVYNTGTIAPGTANTNGIALSQLDAGLTGYAVASCNFLGAHGYAFLFNSTGLSGNYLATVLGSGSATTQYNGTALSLNPLF